MTKGKQVKSWECWNAFCRASKHNLDSSKPKPIPSILGHWLTWRKQSVEQHFVRSHSAGTKDVECCWVRVPRLLDKNEFEICQLPILQDVATCLHPFWNPTQIAMHKPTKSNKYACPSFCSIASSQVGARTLRAYSKQQHNHKLLCDSNLAEPYCKEHRPHSWTLSLLMPASPLDKNYASCRRHSCWRARRRPT